MIQHVLNGYGSPAYSVCDKMPWYNEASETSYDPGSCKNIVRKKLDGQNEKMAPQKKTAVQAGLH